MGPQVQGQASGDLQGLPATLRPGESMAGLCLEAPKGTCPADTTTLDFRLQAGASTFLLFHAPRSVVLGFGAAGDT